MALTAIVGALAAEVHAQPAPEIRHAALACLARNQFTLLTASIIPGDQVRVARVYFRSNAYPDFYFVEMRTASDTFQAILPKPNIETTRVIYYVEVVDDLFNSTRTAENDVEVTETEDQCRRRDPGFAYFAGDNPGIAVGATRVGALAVPPGFLADGIVRFISAAGVAAGAGAGLSTGATVAFAAGAAAAAGLGVGVLNAPDEGRAPSSTDTPPQVPPGGTTTTTTLPPTVTVPGALVACFQTLPDPAVVEEGEPITFDGRCSEPRTIITSFEWDLGDGRPPRDGPFIVAVYQTAGTYTVTLRVSDGARSAVTTGTVRVIPPPSPVVGADFEVTLNVLASLVVGEPIRYEARLTNRGPGSFSGEVSLVVTNNANFPFELVSFDFPSCTVTSRPEVRCSPPFEIRAGQGFHVIFDVTPLSAGSLSVTANATCKATGQDADPDCANNASSQTTTVAAEADLAVSLSGPTSITFYPVDIAATVVNNGPSTANNIKLTYMFSPPPPRIVDECDATTILTSTKPSSGTCTPPASQTFMRGSPHAVFECQVSSLSSGQSFGVNITHDFDSKSCASPGIFAVSASVQSETPDSNRSNDSDSHSVDITFLFLQASRGQQETSFTSHLVVAEADARVGAQVHLNAVRIDTTDNSIPFRHQFRGNVGENTVEGHLVSEIAGEALWRFDFTDASEFVPGSIKVILGQTVSLGSRSVAFRLSGAPGQQIRFTYQLRR